MKPVSPFTLLVTKYLAVKETILNIVNNLNNIKHKKVYSQENTYRVECPFCSTHHSKKMKLYINITPDEIKYNCFICGTHGRIKTKTNTDQKLVETVLEKIEPFKLHLSTRIGIPLTKAGYNYLVEERNIPPNLIEKYRIVEGAVVTKYKGYIIIPIFMFGSEVYFTTRLYDNSKKRKVKSLLPEAKYTMRQKSTVLFNFDVAKHHREIIITEGAFDSIRYPNSVALLGKIISINQLELLSMYFRNTHSIILCLDSKEKDNEIDKAIRKNVNLIKQYLSVNLWVCHLPYGDPADYDTKTFYNIILPKYSKKI